MRAESEYGITDIIIMRNLNFVEKQNVFKLGRISDNAAFSDNRAAADKGAVPYFGVLVDYARTGYSGTCGNPCRTGYPDILACPFKNFGVKPLSYFAYSVL